MGEPKPDQVGSVEASIFFLARLPIYNAVKPFTLRYDPGYGLPATNVESEQHKIEVQDMRSKDLIYDKCGFKYCHISSAMKYGDYADEGIIRRVHFPEVEACLKTTLGATFVEIVDLAQRRRDASFPISTGAAYEYEQPVLRAHIDVTLEAAKNTVREALGARADQFFGRRWQFVNVWHPRRGPLLDYPLAVCDASTVDFEAETMPADLVDGQGVTETVEMQYSAHQKWYYLANQQPDELLIFKNADSLVASGAPYGTPHASFNLHPKPPVDTPFYRESVEMRAFVVW